VLSSVFEETMPDMKMGWRPNKNWKESGIKRLRCDTPVQRSQHLTQADPRVFGQGGQSYVANCSSVNGQAAFRGKRVITVTWNISRA
jgi:hypothetical protein